MNRRIIKTIIDTLLLVGLAIMGITGIGLYLAPSGRVAKATNWTFLGLDRHTLGDIHTYFGLTMLGIGILHLALNWKPLTSLLRTSFSNPNDIVKVATTVVVVLVVALYIGILGW